MTPSDLFSLQLLIHAGFVLSALSFLVRDILWLRLLAIIAYALFCTVALARADGPAWSFVGWYAVFITINAGHAAYLFYERSLMRLNAEECRLRDLTFAALDPVAVKRLMRAGVWLNLPPGEYLTRQGRIAKQVFLIAEGEVVVSTREREIARLGPGRFVGEIGFLAAGPATATARAAWTENHSPVRCLAWNQRKLRHRLVRDDAMRAVMYAALGGDLSAKVADDNVRVTRPATPAMASAE